MHAVLNYAVRRCSVGAQHQQHAMLVNVGERDMPRCAGRFGTSGCAPEPDSKGCHDGSCCNVMSYQLPQLLQQPLPVVAS
jgi:hypothetical protein